MKRGVKRRRRHKKPKSSDSTEDEEQEQEPDEEHKGAAADQVVDRVVDWVVGRHDLLFAFLEQDEDRLNTFIITTDWVRSLWQLAVAQKVSLPDGKLVPSRVPRQLVKSLMGLPDFRVLLEAWLGTQGDVRAKLLACTPEDARLREAWATLANKLKLKKHPEQIALVVQVVEMGKYGRKWLPVRVCERARALLGEARCSTTSPAVAFSLELSLSDRQRPSGLLHASHGAVRAELLLSPTRKLLVLASLDALLDALKEK